MTIAPRGRWVAVALFALLTLAVSAPAAAHSALIGSTPEPESTVEALPDDIELQFNESVSDISPAVILRRDGETVAELEPRIDGSTVRAAAPSEDLPDGDYTVVWRVVSADGHPIEGVVPFTLASGSGDEPAAPEPTTDASEDAGDAAADDAAAAGDSAEDSGPSSAVVVSAVAIGLAVLALLALLVARRGRSGGGPASADDTPSHD